jgi:glycosyltransferase involved in cell wall biosynthesis
MYAKIAYASHASGRGGAELFLRDILLYSDIQKKNWCGVFFVDGPIVHDINGAGGRAIVHKAGENALAIKRGSGAINILMAVKDIFSLAITLRRSFLRYDLICANTQKALFIGGIAARLAGKPFIWILHDIITDRSFSRLNRSAAVFFANALTSKVIVNSEASKRAFIEAGGKPDIAETVYNGFSFEENPFADNFRHKRDALFAELSLKDLPTIGMFGRLSEWKGQHILIEAISQIENVQALIVGDTSYESTDYEQKIRALVDSLGLTARVKFLGFRTDIAELMDVSDAVVHASTQPEPFGRVIVEGMARARPVIATSGGGVDEIVVHEETGLLVEAGDV